MKRIDPRVSADQIVDGNSSELASDGNVISTNMSAVDYGYDVNGNLITETVTISGSTYVKTYTYTAGKLTRQSIWVLQ